MDPNETLRELQDMTAHVFVDLDLEDHPDESGLASTAGRMAELFQALDEWLCSGGAFPDAWLSDEDKAHRGDDEDEEQ